MCSCPIGAYMASETTSEEMDATTSESGERKPIDKIAKELASIRKRRTTDSGRRFPAAREDWVLLMGLGYAALYTLILFGMSTGVFGESTTLDHKASGTFLDINDEACVELADTSWIHAYPDNDAEAVKISGQNLDDGQVILNWTVTGVGNTSAPEVYTGQEENRKARIDYSGWAEGEYEVSVYIDVYNEDANLSDPANLTDDNRTEGNERLERVIAFEITTSDNALAFLPWVDSEVKRDCLLYTSPSPRDA